MKLLDWMDKKSYSFRDLSKAAGVSLSTVERVAYGISKEPQPRVMREIARVLGVDIDEIDEFREAREAKRGKENAALSRLAAAS
jgi:transcriptional regulator with XRE-family HTH domain